MSQEIVVPPYIAQAHSFLRIVLWALLLFSFGIAGWNNTWTAALLVGLPCTVIPTILIARLPQLLLTRLSVGIALMLLVALNIYQARGMIEFHFGIFVLLSLLLFYQDWRVIVTGGVVIAVHHLSFNFLQQAGYGDICFTKPGIGITLIHAAYVVIECVALSYLAILLRKESAAARSGQELLESNFQRMHEIVERSKRGIDSISTAAQEIAQGNADLSARTETQASSLEETVSTMETLTATVRQNSQHSSDAHKLVVSVSDIAGNSGQMMSEVVGTMGSIRDSSRRIVDIISVIDGIAFQTNILALNAAVEAARAGDQGRGFAVVASEVRSLAQRSATAAKEIKHLINDSVEKIEAGDKLADATGQTMGQLVSSIQQVAAIMSEINSSSHEQSDGIAQINQALKDIDESTQQNAALVEQAAAASESLRDNGERLASLLASLEQPGRAADDRSGKQRTAQKLSLR